VGLLALEHVFQHALEKRQCFGSGGSGLEARDLLLSRNYSRPSGFRSWWLFISGGSNSVQLTRYLARNPSMINCTIRCARSRQAGVSGME
jgi:hypothetical protein